MGGGTRPRAGVPCGPLDGGIRGVDGLRNAEPQGAESAR